jgi:alkanesulfonate monooxygenase SsuD/methylene tetrahydromethanopterin reductase-like flavin-dependent oxidoreductase (luciferase family)
MEVGVHLPLIPFDGRPPSQAGLRATAEAARRLGFAALAANDHLVFSRPWLDGVTALAAVVPESGELELATTVALPVVRGTAPMAKALAALDLLSGGRLVTGLGPGSSIADYDLVGVPFDERWPRFEASVRELRRLLDGDEALEPRPTRRLPIWIGSWGSPAGVRRVARLADGWLASAYNASPAEFGEARRRLEQALHERGRDPDAFPNALATMWLHLTDSADEADRVLREVLAPMVGREAELLAQRVCVGSPGECAAKLRAYAAEGCRRVYLWPLGDDVSQLELFAERVRPALEA